MTTINYEGIEYNVVYIDPSRGTAGNGSSPANALKNFPNPLVNNTAYIIRRTPEAYYTNIAQTGNKGFKNIMLLGASKSKKEKVYSLMPQEVIDAWGNDDAECYANVRMDQATYNSTMTNCCFYETSIITFIANNCYFMRSSSGGSAVNYTNHMFYLNGRDFLFEGCKFGYTQYDFDNPDFRASNTGVSTDTSKYPQRKCTAYIYMNYAKHFTMNNCVINAMCTDNCNSNNEYSYTTRECGIYLCDVRFFKFTNGTLNKFFWCNYTERETTTCQGVISTNFNNVDNYHNSVYKNITLNCIFNTNAVSNIAMIRDRHYDCKMDDVKINFYTMKDYTFTGKTFSVNWGYRMIELSARQHMCVSNITCDATVNENATFGSLPTLYISRVRSDVNGPSSYVRNINIKYADKDSDCTAIASGTVFEINQRGDMYNVTGAYSTSYDYTQYVTAGKDVVARDVQVYAPLSTSNVLTLIRSSLKQGDVYGHVYLDSSCLVCNKIYNHYGTTCGIYLYNNSFLDCKEYYVNPLTYDGSLQIDYSRNQMASFCIGKTNGRLFNENFDTTNYVHSQMTIGICPNYLVDGQFYARNTSVFAKSWGVARTGSNSAASIKFNSNNYNGAPLVIGQEPIKGFEIVPASTGDKIITAYVALKNFNVDQNLISEASSYVYMEVQVPEVLENGDVVYNSYDSLGCWREDDSTWSGDTDLTMFKIEIPVTVTNVENAINIKLKYDWYHLSGSMYFDPDIKIMDLN